MPLRRYRDIISGLHRVSGLIRNYPKEIKNVGQNPSLVEDFGLAASYVNRLLLDLQMGDDNQLDNLKKSLIAVSNATLAGSLSELPKAEVNNLIIEENKKPRPLHYLLLAVYLTLPIIIVMILNIAFKITFNEYNQALLKILYIIWAFVGIFSNPITLRSENKDLIKDIIKTWLGKG